MSTDFLNRTQALQETVLSYFYSYPGEAVVHTRPNLPGAVDVQLSGQLASRFDSVSTPLDQAGRRQLRLLFNRDFAGIAPGYELVAPGSPVLRIMQNDLAGRSAFSRAALLFNIDGNFEDLRAFNIQIRHASPTAQCAYLARRYYLLRYLVRLTSYEKTEDIIPIVVDAETTKALPEGAAGQFSQASLVDMHQAPFRDDVALPAPDAQELEKVIRVADKTVEKRIQGALRERCAELAVQLNQELERTDRHFESEFKTAAPAERQELERVKAQKVQELKDRYALRMEVALLSVQEIIAPRVQYTLAVPNGRKTKVIDQPFIFDPLAGGALPSVTTTPCERCRQQHHWAYCALGHHLDCGVCGTVETCSHSRCETAMCAEHAIRCGECQAALCLDHQRSCRYCDRRRRYCARHIVRSFENKEICPRCATACADCARIFPPSGVQECVVCAQVYCGDHRTACPSCTKPYCQHHGGLAQGHQETYCLNCLTTCAGCGDQVSYLRSDLQFCGDCGQALCSTHLVVCITCTKAICAEHTLQTPYGKGCDNCFAACSTCKQLEQRSRLAACSVCGPKVTKRHCPRHVCVACRKVVCEQHTVATAPGKGCVQCFAACNTCRTVHHRSALLGCHLCAADDVGMHCQSHAQACTVCQKAACDQHRVVLHDSRAACFACASPCTHCQAYYPRADLVACQECGKLVCLNHKAASQFRAESYCLPHAQTFRVCPGCDRRGPAAQMQSCPLCGLDYCPHCQSDQPGKRCAYCQHLEPLPSPNDALREWARAVHLETTLSREARRELVQALTTPNSGYELTWAENRGHVIIHGVYRGGFFGFVRRLFRHVKSFLVVGNRADSTARIRVNL